MVRPREFDENQVTEAIMMVFWEKGYEATSMQDIVEATGLLKGSLYGAFGDKHALYMAALKQYDQNYINAAINMLERGGNCHENIARLFDSVKDSVDTGVFAGGCLLCNASVEMAPVDDAVRQEVQNQISRLQKAVARAIAQAGHSDPGYENSVNSLARFIVSLYFGTRVTAKAGMSTQFITDAKVHCLSLLPEIQFHC
jgi:TetR/AcrR family transcriptional repressor of nem operon